MSQPWERAADALRARAAVKDSLGLDEALELVRQAYMPPEPSRNGTIVMASTPSAVALTFYVRNESGWRQDGDGSPVAWRNVCRTGWNVTELEPAGRVSTLLDELVEALESHMPTSTVRIARIRGIVAKWAAKE